MCALIYLSLEYTNLLALAYQLDMLDALAQALKADKIQGMQHYIQVITGNNNEHLGYLIAHNSAF